MAKRNIVQIAHQYLGVPYVWGGTTAKGLDCSGFLQLVYRNFGINIPRTTYEQVKAGQAVNLKGIKPGDAVFVEPTKAGPGHVGMYIGNGMVQQSPHTGAVNSVIPLSAFIAGGVVGIRRYANNAGQALPAGSYSGAPKAIGVGGNAIQHQPKSDNSQQIMQLIQGVLTRNASNTHALIPQINPITVHPEMPNGTNNLFSLLGGSNGIFHPSR